MIYPPYLSPERLKTDDDRVEVLSLPEVDRLEGFLSGDTHGSSSLKESVDVLHTLEGHLTLVDLLHGARFQCIDQSETDYV